MRKKYKDLVFNSFKKGRLLYLLKQPFKLAGVKLSLSISKRLASPLVGTLIPTYRCNSNCPKCVKKDMYQTQEEASTDELKAIIKDLGKIGVSAIDFTGGEPLLREDIFELLSFASKQKVITHLNTNAYLLTKDTAEKIVNSGLDSVNISLDSIDRNKVKEMTGVEEAFDLIVTGIKNLIAVKQKKKAALEVNIVSVLSYANAVEVEALVSLAKDLGVDGISFNPLHKFPCPIRKNPYIESMLAAVDRIID